MHCAVQGGSRLCSALLALLALIDAPWVISAQTPWASAPHLLRGVTCLSDLRTVTICLLARQSLNFWHGFMCKCDITRNG